MPPSVRSAAAAAAAAPPDAPAEVPQNSLLGLPEELLHLVADALLHKHLPSALRLRQASTALRGRLAAVRAAAEARRLRWVPELTNTEQLTISDEGRALTYVGGSSDFAWALGSLLPTAGRVSFSVRIERSKDNEGKGIVIGVCNEVGTCGWGLWAFTGKLERDSRNADGKPAYGTPPPEGWPDGRRTQVMVDEDGEAVDLIGRATGAVIEVVVDHSDGSLAFGVNGAPPRRVPEGWPHGYNPNDHLDEEDHVPPAKVPFKFSQGAQLRPWAWMWGYKENRVSFARPRYL